MDNSNVNQCLLSINNTLSNKQNYWLDKIKVNSIVSFLLNYSTGSHVAILVEKSYDTIACMVGCLFAGTPYTVLDPDSPVSRLVSIINTLNCSVIITDKSHKSLAKTISQSATIIDYESITEAKIDEEKLRIRQKQIKEDDTAYVLFTSGSTGTPKGTIITYNNIYSYISWYVNRFEITKDTIIANQTPFYFSMSVTDIYSALFTGAKLMIVPKEDFAFPVKLVQFLNDNKVNTIYWVPSVFSIITYYKLFDYIKPLYLKNIFFAGEVMQNRWLNYWRKNIPDARYVNLFGPTETTDICAYYEVNRPFKDDEPLPIGKECEGIHDFLVGPNKELITKPAETGEMYVDGPFVAKGYINNPNKTKECFVPNPVEPNGHICYKTGDICYYNDKGELMYSSRADFQIKHMGYRIELGEIESGLLTNERVMSCCACYDKNKDEIVMFFSGRAKEDEALKYLTTRVPSYMIPNIIRKVDNIAMNQNGKVDHKYYSSHLNELIAKK